MISMKKLLSLLLCIAIFLTFTPGMVWAGTSGEGSGAEDVAVARVEREDGTEVGTYTSLQAAIDATVTENGKTIFLLDNAEIDTTIKLPEAKNVLIFVGGQHTISASDSFVAGANMVEIDHGKIVFHDLTIDGKNKATQAVRAINGAAELYGVSIVNCTGKAITLQNEEMYLTGTTVNGQSAFKDVQLLADDNTALFLTDTADIQEAYAFDFGTEFSKYEFVNLMDLGKELWIVTVEPAQHSDGYNAWVKDSDGIYRETKTTPVTPPPTTPTTPTTPTQPPTTTTVDTTTNPDGSTTTTTTEKDTATGTETKTEITQGTDGVTSNTEITAETDSKTNGTETETIVDKETADKVLEEAIKSEQKAEAAGATKKTTVITFEAKSFLGNTTKVEMSIPTEFAKGVLDKTDSEIKIKTVLGEVQLSQKTLEKAVNAEETDQIKISVESMAAEKLSNKIVEAIGAEAQVLDFSIQAGNTSIHAFDGGKAYITLDIPKTIDPEKTEAVYIKPNGFVERVVGALLNIGGVPKYQIAADHFSYYALVDKDTAEAAIQKTNKAITKGVKNTKVVSLKAKANKGKIKLTWKKSKSGYKLDGYQIYKSKKKKAGYKKMMTTAGLSYVNTAGVKKGQTYWYKVRGYRTVDDKKVYTDWKQLKVKAK